jgi:hypothetical protein
MVVPTPGCSVWFLTHMFVEAYLKLLPRFPKSALSSKAFVLPSAVLPWKYSSNPLKHSGNYVCDRFLSLRITELCPYSACKWLLQ